MKTGLNRAKTVIVTVATYDSCVENHFMIEPKMMNIAFISDKH